MAENEVVKKQKPKKERNGSWLGRKLKEVWSELKKVTWPTFPVVVKSIGVVLAVCALFLVVLFGFDYLLQFVNKLLTTGSF